MTEPPADLRLAFRLLRRNRTLTISVITTLALAIGAGVATFAIAEAALIAPPPFPEPDRLVMLFTTHTEPARGTERYRWSYPRFRLLEKSLTTASSIGDYGLASVNLAGQMDAEPVSSEIVAGAYFATLGARPMRGRLFSAEEDHSPSAPMAVILSHGLWRRRYGGDIGIIGQTVRVNSRELTVIGIMPPGFRGLTGRAEMWVPATQAPRLTYPEYLTSNQDFTSVVARLRPGVSVDALPAELTPVGAALQRDPFHAGLPRGGTRHGRRRDGHLGAGATRQPRHPAHANEIASELSSCPARVVRRIRLSAAACGA